MYCYQSYLTQALGIYDTVTTGRDVTDFDRGTVDYVGFLIVLKRKKLQRFFLFFFFFLRVIFQ